MISDECRRESNRSVKRQIRYSQILDILSSGRDMTAREVAMEMYRRGLINTADRNNAAPRLTELVEKGCVVESGTKYDNQTNKNVTAYRIKNKPMMADYKQLTFLGFTKER